MEELLYLFTTMDFAYPLVLLFIPVIFFLLIMLRKRREAVPVASAELVADLPRSFRLIFRKPVLTVTLIFFITALGIAAARPQRSLTLNEPSEHRNLILALDISKSMSINDFGSRFASTSRLRAVKAVVKEFIDTRTEDRLGLVVFGSNAYLQSPLTLDHSIILSLVDRLEVGMAGDGTAIGDGLGLSVKRIQEIPGSSKAIILLTDGVSNSGKVNPLKAAKVAADLDIKVHTIGIGSHSGTIRDIPGGFLLPSQGPEYDEVTLKEIAQTTGGLFFNASDLEGLKKVYEEINRLEKSEREENSRKKVDELFPFYLSIALIAYLTYLLFARYVCLLIP